jgi:RNA polymerase sigma factor (TIGR02999 family)
MANGAGEITRLLAQLGVTVDDGSERLIELVYQDLRAIAAACMRRERPDHTLQATVLVHDAYLRLAAASGIRWQNRAHFFAIAAKVMRRILVEYAREHRALKRGGAVARVALDDALMVTEEHLEKALLLDRSLQRLASVDPEHSRLVELRFFAGLSVEETSEVMGISTATVKREWSHAKAWLQRDMRARGAHAGG